MGKVRTGMIDALGLSTRVANCLKRNGIYTEKQLLMMNDEDLMQLSGFGATCLQEVREKVSESRKPAPLPKVEKLSLPDAINALVSEYERADRQEHVRNPMAFALREVLKMAGGADV